MSVIWFFLIIGALYLAMFGYACLASGMWRDMFTPRGPTSAELMAKWQATAQRKLDEYRAQPDAQRILHIEAYIASIAERAAELSRKHAA